MAAVVYAMKQPESELLKPNRVRKETSTATTRSNNRR